MDRSIFLLLLPFLLALNHWLISRPPSLSPELRLGMDEGSFLWEPNLPHNLFRAGHDDCAELIPTCGRPSGTTQAPRRGPG